LTQVLAKGLSLLAHRGAVWGLIAFLLCCSSRFFFERVAGFGRHELASSLVAVPATGHCSRAAGAH
jgi:hypothetical protein